MQATTLLPSQISITNTIAAVGALGTAAYGLVDAFKAFGGGVSNAGFSSIESAVTPYIHGFGANAFGRKDILETLRANWINGMAKADQKAVAKALIRLSLTPGNAERLASATGVDTTQLTAVVNKVHKGDVLLPTDFNILGQFDAVVSAALDRGYERADQQYRNSSKALAALVAVILAVTAGGLIFCNANPKDSIFAYLGSSTLLVAILVGLVSTPLAPIAKDLSTALNNAVAAVSAAKRK